MKKTIIILLSLIIYSSSAQTRYGSSKNIKSQTNIFGEVAFLEAEYSNDDGFKNKNIVSYILGLTSTTNLNKTFDIIGSIGFSEGFDYTFATSNLGIKLSNNLHIFYGVGTYYISDKRWGVVGLNGNEASRFEFGMNSGIKLHLSNNFGIVVKYNFIEKKEDFSVGSMSLNGLSFGIILK
tara:strand:+ start:1521 stop:2060 length:540 start_codon:yes stop_codon:yes gene_type:complete